MTDLNNYHPCSYYKELNQEQVDKLKEIVNDCGLPATLDGLGKALRQICVEDQSDVIGMDKLGVSVVIGKIMSIFNSKD